MIKLIPFLRNPHKIEIYRMRIFRKIFLPFRPLITIGGAIHGIKIGDQKICFSAKQETFFWEIIYSKSPFASNTTEMGSIS